MAEYSGEGKMLRNSLFCFVCVFFFPLRTGETKDVLGTMDPASRQGGEPDVLSMIQLFPLFGKGVQPNGFYKQDTVLGECILVWTDKMTSPGC